MDDTIGTWALNAYRMVESEMVPTLPSEKRAAIGTFLVGDDFDCLDELELARGLQLRVLPSGRFEQTAEPAFDRTMIDFEGATTSLGSPDFVVAFDGRLIRVGSRLYLHPDDAPARSTSEGRWVEAQLLRYDDGDTVVCEWIEKRGTSLFRTASMVTDEAYLSRLTLRYERKRA